MAETASSAPTFTDFQTHPSRYRHWKFAIEGPVARLALDVQEDEAAGGGMWVLKQNSYDLGVDIELADALQRLRFEHPEVRALVITSAVARIFCAGANIYMLGKSTHAFKVNFCKFTNETRLGIEDLSRGTGVHTIAALNGTAAGGGYELALACDEICLVNDGNSAVSFPEIPLLAVLPGTGGLTRLVDKRMIRRDRADVFCTIAEGIKGRRAKEWGLVDELYPKSIFESMVTGKAAAAAARAGPGNWKGAVLAPLEVEAGPDRIAYRHVEVRCNEATRTAELRIQGPPAGEPVTGEAMLARGSDLWALRAFRELDDALLHLRIDRPGINIVTVRTEGDRDAVLQVDRALEAEKDHGFVREVRLLIARVLRRMDLTAKSFFALVEPGSCFAGTLFELALASDRIYMLDDGKGENRIALSSLNGDAYPMTHGPTRLGARFLGDPTRPARLLAEAPEGGLDAAAADEAGLVTMALDDLDYEDEVRIAVEERASLSPDALTGMEASLRFPGPENRDSKIFARLSAWQNWIFQRPNAVGPKGALTSYGQPTRPEFDYRRT